MAQDTVERHLWLDASFGDPETYRALRSSEPQDIRHKESLVLILSVPAGSRAAQLGLRKGDLVISVNGQSVSTLHQFKKVIRETDRRTPFKVQVKRGSEVVSLGRK